MDDLEFKLVGNNWVNHEQLNLARQDASRYGKTLWVSLVKLGYISEENIAIFFAQESGISYVRACDYEIRYETLRSLKEDYCRAHFVIPLFKVKDTLFVACSNPFDAALLEEISKLAGSATEFLIASRRSISLALDLYWGPEERTFEAAGYIVKQPTVQGLGFWRESERLDLNINVDIKIEDPGILLHGASVLEGTSRNISGSGTAIGLQVFLFLPKGTIVSMEFKPQSALLSTGQTLKAKGEIVHSYMEKGSQYFIGIRFTEIAQEALNSLFTLAGRK